MVGAFEERVRVPVMKRVSWPAIFGGLAVTLGLELLFSLLGIGIGASTIHPTDADGASAQSVGIGSAVWFIITSLIALFAGGWVAGRLAGIPHRTDAVLHGVITWSLTSLFTIYLLTTAIGGIITGATGALGSVLQAAGSGIAAVAPQAAKAASDQAEQNGISVNSVAGDLSTRAQKILRETGNPKLSPENLKAAGQHQINSAKNAAQTSALDPSKGDQTANDLLYKFLHNLDGTTHAADRESLINVVAAEQHITKAQAARTVDGWAAQAKKAEAQAKAALDQAHEKAKQAGDATAAAVSKAALSAFFLFLLGGLAAAAGGLVSLRSILADAVFEDKRRFGGASTTTGETRIHQNL